MKKIFAILIMLASLNIAFAQSVNTVYLRQIKPEQITQPTIEVMLFLMDLSLGGKSINDVGALCFLDGTCRSSWTGLSTGGGGNITVNTFTGNITIQGSSMINVTNATTADGGSILITFDNTSLANLDIREQANNITQDRIKANLTDLNAVNNSKINVSGLNDGVLYLTKLNVSNYVNSTNYFVADSIVFSNETSEHKIYILNRSGINYRASNLTIISGSGTAGALGGSVSLLGGIGGDDAGDGVGIGGNIHIISGTGGNSNGIATSGGNGGFLEILGGNAGKGTANADGGDVYIAGGLKSLNGINGDVLLGVRSNGSIYGNVGIGTTSPVEKLDVRGDINVTGIVNASNYYGTWSGENIPLDNISNPLFSKEFTLANKFISWRFTNPIPDTDGVFTIETSGAFAGDLLHVHSEGGNPSTSNLLHLEAEDADVTALLINGTLATIGIDARTNMNLSGFINLSSIIFSGIDTNNIRSINGITERNGLDISILVGSGGTGVSDGAGIGGNFLLRTGNGGNSTSELANTGTGGLINLTAGTGGNSLFDASIGGGNGGLIFLRSGDGGLASVEGGAGGTGGRIILLGGNGKNTSAGGDIYITGGNGSQNRDGNIYLARTTAGRTQGKVLIATTTLNGDLVRISGNVTIDGNLSLTQAGSRLGVASPINSNYTINSLRYNGTSYTVNGTDYSEAVPKLNPLDNITTGDIVGIHTGRASKTTTNAHAFMVVSGHKIGVLAGEADFMENYVIARYETKIEVFNETKGELENVTVTVEEIGTRFKEDFTTNKYVPVAFVGQVKVKVNGLCTGGNYVIPSGNNDGYGICVNPKLSATVGALATYMTDKVCIAWQNKETLGNGIINCAITGGM